MKSATAATRTTRGLLALLGAAAVAAGVWFAGAATTALAPEPARISQSLSGEPGTTAAGVYVYSGADTLVLKWSSSYTSSANPPTAGTPCATGNLAAGDQTSKVIQAGSGSYRRCV